MHVINMQVSRVVCVVEPTRHDTTCCAEMPELELDSMSCRVVPSEIWALLVFVIVIFLNPVVSWLVLLRCTPTLAVAVRTASVLLTLPSALFMYVRSIDYCRPFFTEVCRK